MSEGPDSEDLYLLVQGLADRGQERGIYDEVDDVRALLDGLGDVLHTSNKIQTKPQAKLHQSSNFNTMRNLRQLVFSNLIQLVKVFYYFLKKSIQNR